jgi:hypothetical protein
MDAETIARALGGHRNGANWAACCPAHDDGNPSLSISEADDGKVLVHCHAGCRQEQVVSKLRALGLWSHSGIRQSGNANAAARSAHLADENASRTDAGLRLWPIFYSANC